MIELLPIILFGFGLGMVHALDADHVMAISALGSQNQSSLGRTLKLSAHWAIGHGAMLLLIGLLLFGLGFSIPPSWQHVAEVSVGFLLIGLGLACFWRFRKEKIQLHRHRHGEIVHTHWHDEAHLQEGENKKTNSHVPVMVGGLHGLAGSAPALALIPAVGQGEVMIALVYLGVFSLGVMVAMALFGLGLGYVQQYLKQQFSHALTWLRHGVALAAISIGCFWVAQAL